MGNSSNNSSVYDYASSFTGGHLPKLVYVTRQNYDAQQLIRPMHRHEEIAEFLLVYEGSGHYNVENQFHEVKKGDVLLYNAGTLHEVATNKEEKIGTFCFGVTDLRLNGLPVNHLTDAKDGFVRHSNEYFAQMLSMSHLIYTTLNNENEYNQEICLHLTVALMLLMIHLPGNTLKGMRSEDFILVDRIKNFVDENFRDNINIDSIAKALHISPSYASHIFKAATGYSIKKYLSRRRIGEAETQLLSSNASVTEIAHMVGFNDSNYFNTVFSKTVGLTPRRYRVEYSAALRGTHTQ